jgi:hypothetical protein
MKAWQLTTVLAVVAIAAGQLPQRVAAEDAPPVRAQLDRVVGTADYGFVGPEERGTVSLDSVDATIRGQRSIKQCFFAAQRELGFLPDVIVRFRILPSGTVETASISDPATLQGSTLDACLSHALATTRFAPFSGNGVWLNYPFEF